MYWPQLSGNLVPPLASNIVDMKTSDINNCDVLSCSQNYRKLLLLQLNAKIQWNSWGNKKRTLGHWLQAQKVPWSVVLHVCELRFTKWKDVKLLVSLQTSVWEPDAILFTQLNWIFFNVFKYCSHVTENNKKLKVHQ